MERPYILFLLLTIVLFVGIFLLMLRWKRKAALTFGEANLIKILIPEESKSKLWLKFALLMISFVFLIIGLTNPRSGNKTEKVKHKGVELIICLDVSNSMLAQDIKPNRLERAKQAIGKLIERLEKDKIGIIIFAGKSYIQLPLTPDYSAAKMYLSTISTEMVPVQGTAIGSAITEAVKAFNIKDSGKNKHRAIIIITDGENHEDDAVDAAKTALNSGIFVHTIGIGLPEGSPIPVVKSGVINGYKTDAQGKTIISKLNEEMLEKIAAAGNGIYVRAKSSEIGLNKIFNEINKMDKTEIDSKVYAEYESHFQYFIAIAILLLIIEIFIFERKNIWFSRLNLFGEEKQKQ